MQVGVAVDDVVAIAAGNDVVAGAAEQDVAATEVAAGLRTVGTEDVAGGLAGEEEVTLDGATDDQGCAVDVDQGGPVVERGDASDVNRDVTRHVGQSLNQGRVVER